MSTARSDQPLPPPEAVDRRVRSCLPPKWLWAVLAVLGILGVIVRSTDILGDHAFANIATWLLGFAAVVTATVWFLFLSGFRRRVRVLTLVGAAAGLSLLAVLFRIERVSGELTPMFALRFSAKPDRLLQALPSVAAAAVDLRTTTDDDFPQFLGPHRSDSVEHVRLARDWTSQPPQLVWRHEIGAAWSAFSAVNGHAVTMEQQGDAEMITCYSIETGRLEWANAAAGRFEKWEAGVGPRSTPTIDEGMVYALAALGRLACLDGATGKTVWEKNLLQEYGITAEDEAAAVPWGRAASPLVVGDRLIVPIGGRNGGRMVSLAAFDKHSGAKLWEGGQQQISYSSPALATLGGIEQILIANEASLSGHDLQTGRTLWEHPWPGHTNQDPNVSQPVPIAPDRVFISKGYGQGTMLLQLDPAADGALTTRVVWKSSRVMKTKFANVAIRDGCVYGLSDGILECVELANGLSKWKGGRYGHGQTLLVGDLLLVVSEKGEVVLVEATPDRPNNVMGRFQAIEGMTWNNLALYGPYLLVRNAEEAACYKLPLEGQP